MVAFVVAAALCGVLVGIAERARRFADRLPAGSDGNDVKLPLPSRAVVPNARDLVGRIDHTTIFAAIAGTYMHGGAVRARRIARLRFTVLAIVWGATVAGVAVSGRRSPCPAGCSPRSTPSSGGRRSRLGHSSTGRSASSGSACWRPAVSAYTIGAVVYATKRPIRWPRVFGFHEVFHVCTVVGASSAPAVIGLIVLPRA